LCQLAALSRPPPPGGEDERVTVACRRIAVEVLAKQLRNEPRHGDGAPPGVCLGLGAVTADLGRGLEDVQATAGCVHAPDTEPGHLGEAEPACPRDVDHRSPPVRKLGRESVKFDGTQRDHVGPRHGDSLMPRRGTGRGAPR
jgi:hypothetical protein